MITYRLACKWLRSEADGVLSNRPGYEGERKRITHKQSHLSEPAPERTTGGNSLLVDSGEHEHQTSDEHVTFANEALTFLYCLADSTTLLNPS